MTIGSLYSGAIDGFAYAAQALGIEVKYHVERDKRAHKYLNKNYPNTKIYTYDEHVGKHNLEWTNIIAGGDPCQPSSNAGLRLGKADDRYRWPQMFRIIREMRPDWVINENVVGTVSNMVLDQKIIDLESAGYACQAYNIPAVAVGADHERQRIWLVANSYVQRRRELLHHYSSPFSSESSQAITLGAQGNPFLRFEESETESALLSMVDGIPDHIFRLGAAGNSVASPIPIILLKAILAIDEAFK